MAGSLKGSLRLPREGVEPVLERLEPSLAVSLAQEGMPTLGLILEETLENQLANRLEGLANSLRNGWIPIEGIYGNLLLELETAGYLNKKEEHYVKLIKPFR